MKAFVLSFFLLTFYQPTTAVIVAEPIGEAFNPCGDSLKFTELEIIHYSEGIVLNSRRYPSKFYFLYNNTAPKVADGYRKYWKELKGVVEEIAEQSGISTSDRCKNGEIKK